MARESGEVGTAGRPNKGMKLTKPGQLRSFAAYPRCSTDVTACELAWLVRLVA